MTPNAYGEKRLKPSRPTKRVQKQLQAIDAETRDSSNNIPSKEEIMQNLTVIKDATMSK